jgi:hypothetical protein
MVLIKPLPPRHVTGGFGRRAIFHVVLAAVIDGRYQLLYLSKYLNIDEP